jgi:3D (Asp-Asp-Asp) domain-containing protein
LYKDSPGQTPSFKRVSAQKWVISLFDKYSDPTYFYRNIKLRRSIFKKQFVFLKLLVVIAVIHLLVNLAAADIINPTGPVDDKQPKLQTHASIRVVTAYNVGDPRQTDDTPCVSANGEDICEALIKGEKRCAANFVPLGTRLHVETVGVCLVTDRTNRRYRDRVDIAMHKHEYQKAIQFGRQNLMVKVIGTRR